MPCGSPFPVVRIFVAEAKRVLVDRVSVLSEQYSDLLLVGAASTGQSAVAGALRASPDVVLVEQELPDADGLAVCEDICRQQPRVAIVLISEMQTERAMLAAVEAGARGLISPLASDDEVAVTILRAADGEFLLSGQVVQRLFRIGRELRQGGCLGRYREPAAAN